MLTVPEASARILEHIAPLAIERVPLLDALGMVLAEPVRAPMTLPAWDNSAMDGYAVRGADIDAASADHPVACACWRRWRRDASRRSRSVTARPFGS
jgi:molybdopterin molybdotransferase